MAGVIRLILSFVFGSAATAAMFVISHFTIWPLDYGGAPAAQVGLGLFVVTMVMAGILAWPVLLVACLTLMLFRNAIYRNLGLWCATAVALSGLAYVAIDYMTLNSADLQFSEFVTREPVIVRITFALVVSLFTAIGFYFWTRTGEATPGRNRAARDHS